MIKKTFLLLVLLLVVTGICFAQIVALSGKVSDEKTGSAITGASVRVGRSATSTNSLGEFYLVINKPDVLQNGITVTCVAYQTQHLAWHDSDYNIRLQPSTQLMHEVNILAPGESIVQKAIRKIPQNYPGKDVNMLGILRILETSKDSAGTYLYYKNDAVVKMYYPAYNKPADAEVSIIQNRFTHIKDPVHDADSVHWYNGYLVVPRSDVVHRHSGFVSLGGMKKFTYTNQGKTMVNNTHVHQISFYAENISGSLYIDTATYAFVNISYTTYHIERISQVTIDKATDVINYKQTGGKWYISDIKTTKTGKYNGLTLDYVMDYKTTGIDSASAEPIKYHDWLQSNSENIKFNKPGTDADWQKYNTLFAGGEKDSILTVMPVPVIDTTPKKVSGGHKASNSITNYILHGNMHSFMQFSRVPLGIAGYQPLLSKNIGASADYLVDFGLNLSLYKPLFLTASYGYNFGLGGVKATAANGLLGYHIGFNKQHHPITLSPGAGVNMISVKDNDKEYLNQINLSFGFTATYELNHWISVFAGLKYLDPLSTDNKGLVSTNQNIYPSVGISL